MNRINYFGFPGTHRKGQKSTAIWARDIVCKTYDISTEELNSNCRKRYLVEARHVLMYLLRKKLAMKLTAIGEFMGGMHYSTVIHSVSTAEDLITTDADFAKQLREVELKLLHV